MPYCTAAQTSCSLHLCLCVPTLALSSLNGWQFCLLSLMVSDYVSPQRFQGVPGISTEQIFLDARSTLPVYMMSKILFAGLSFSRRMFFSLLSYLGIVSVVEDNIRN